MTLLLIALRLHHNSYLSLAIKDQNLCYTLWNQRSFLESEVTPKVQAYLQSVWVKIISMMTTSYPIQYGDFTSKYFHEFGLQRDTISMFEKQSSNSFFFNPREHTGTNCIQKGQPECHTKSLMNQFFNSMQLRKWRISSRSLSSNQGTKLDYYKG